MKRLMIGLAFLLIAVLAVGCAKETPIEPDQSDEPIGGQRDEHGCLGPAGYSWNETLGACVREWELDTEGKRTAVTIAAGEFQNRYSLTVVDVEVARCPGCFNVKFTDADYAQIEVKLSNWAVADDSEEPADQPEITNFEECVAAGNPVMESYPRQCRHGDQTFVEDVEPICVDRCGDGVCAEYVCMGTGCPCSENKQSCPEDCA